MPASDQGVQPERYQLIPRVLVFVIHESHVLLLKGLPAKRVWPNKYNGVGGHVERDEAITAAARREVLEETGLQVSELRFRGIINIAAGPSVGIGMFVFTARADGLEVVASAEGALEWVAFDQLGGLPLVDDLRVLLPQVLQMDDSAPPFFGKYWYSSDGQLQIDLTGS